MRYPLAMPISQGRGNNRLGELLAQYFSTRIAEGPLRCRIKLDNPPFVIDADNAIQCGLQDGPFASFAPPQRLFCPLAFSDFVSQFFVGGFELCGALVQTRGWRTMMRRCNGSSR